MVRLIESFSRAGGYALAGAGGGLFQFVVPVELHEDRGGDQQHEDAAGPVPLPQHDEDGQRDQAELPHDADGDVGEIVRGVAVGHEGRIFRHDLRADRAPPAPGVHGLVKFLQHGLVLRLAQQGAGEAADQRDDE